MAQLAKESLVEFHVSLHRQEACETESTAVQMVGGTLLEAALIGFAVLIAALARDWFGLANALSMASLIMVWATIIHYNHTSLDRALEKIPDGKRTWDMKKELLQPPIERPCYSLHLSGSPRKAF